MNSEVKEKWVAALRDKERYTQTRRKLRDENGFCCLGVLCDLYLSENGREWERSCGGGYEIEEKTEFLPHSVQDWAEFEQPIQIVRLPSEDTDCEGSNTFVTWNLVELNDNLKYSFEQIADLIEEQL